MKTPLNKLLLFAALALLVINIVLVYLLWKDKGHNNGKSRNGNRGDWMVNELKLNEEQKKEHKKIKDAHFAKMKPVTEAMTDARTRLYNLLKDSVVNDSLVKHYAQIIGDRHTEASVYTFEHFKQIRAICTPEQKVKLDELIQKIVKDMARRGNKSKSKDEK